MLVGLRDHGERMATRLPLNNVGKGEVVDLIVHAVGLLHY